MPSCMVLFPSRRFPCPVNAGRGHFFPAAREVKEEITPLGLGIRDWRIGGRPAVGPSCRWPADCRVPLRTRAGLFGGGRPSPQQANAAAVFVGERYSAAVDLYAGGDVLGDEQDAVEIGVIQQRQHLGGGRNAHARFGEAADHGFHAAPPGVLQHPLAGRQSAAFRQLHVDAVEKPLQRATSSSVCELSSAMIGSAESR